MPKRKDIHTVFVLGSGPIIIGQACEFDYAGTQGCLALKEEGCRVILLNSNPATIMTDIGIADVTYIEPMTPSVAKRIIEKERPHAILATLGGQTALNLLLELASQGILERFSVEVIGPSIEAIRQAEDRNLFHQIMQKAGITTPRSFAVTSILEALQVAGDLGFPLFIRSSFSLGGASSGLVYNREELILLCSQPFALGLPLQIDEDLSGWKEFEFEVVSDSLGQSIAICAIENIDPVGIHTGDSITVCPCLTLTDPDYQKMRTLSFDVMKELGCRACGANIQFALHPKDRRIAVIEMNPRMSRSSALASKATSYPIAKIATQLALGYTLDELAIRGMPASMEPVIDYVVVKIPKFQFDKFPSYEDRLFTKMQSIGEVFAIGSSFSSALLKAMRSIKEPLIVSLDLKPSSARLWNIFYGLRQGMSIEEIFTITHIDPWFLYQMFLIVLQEREGVFTKEGLLSFKKYGFSNAHIATCLAYEEKQIDAAVHLWQIQPVFKRVDGCAAEYPSPVPCYYSSYEDISELTPSNQPTVVVIGSGANTIGQGIEFDYACVHACKALKALGIETVMINCNPETVSTDYTAADRLYISPLTVEDVLDILKIEKPLGILIQYGGQTALNLGLALEKYGAVLLGVDPCSIDRCEDRTSFAHYIHSLGLRYPKMFSAQEALLHLQTKQCILRPSFVLGGARMQILSHPSELEKAVIEDGSFIIEEFLSDAIEIDVDVISDGKEVFIPAIMQQHEKAGIHSGDSTCSIPPFSLRASLQDKIREYTERMALDLGIKGLLNIQYAIQGDDIFVLEVNPRASRSIPFLCKALGIDLIDLSIRAIFCDRVGYPTLNPSKYFFTKAPIFSSKTFTSALGPEMRSTGETMGFGLCIEESSNRASGQLAESSSRSYTLRSLQEVVEIPILAELTLKR